MKKTISLNIENEEIVFADLLNRERLELILVCKSGNVFLFSPDSNSITLIFENFPLTKHILIVFNFENYVCLVERTRGSGLVIDLADKTYQKKLERGDYCVEHTYWSIAFYKRNNQTFLIHGTDWNRLDITCLETDELLTERIVDYETDSNYFDYFHSSLSISPDENHFTSNGWVWHPYGQITLYSIDSFLENFELSHKDIHLADDCYSFDSDRPLCWVDEKTLAIGFSRNTEDYGKTDFADEILFFDIVENKIINRIEFNGFGNTSDGDVFGELFYDSEGSRFISLNKKKGLFVSDLEGKKIFEDQNLASHKYSLKHKFFYRINYHKQIIEMVKI